MIHREEIESWVKEAMKASDAEYQLVEVVRTAIEVTADRCAEIVGSFDTAQWSDTQRNVVRIIAHQLRHGSPTPKSSQEGK